LSNATRANARSHRSSRDIPAAKNVTCPTKTPGCEVHGLPSRLPNPALAGARASAPGGGLSSDTSAVAFYLKLKHAGYTIDYLAKNIQPIEPNQHTQTMAAAHDLLRQKPRSHKTNKDQMTLGL